MLNKPPRRPPVAVRPPVAIKPKPQPGSQRQPRRQQGPKPPAAGSDLGQALRGPAVGVLIAALTLYLGFNAGGFFAGDTAIAALAVCLALVLGVMLISRPFESFTPALVVALALLAGFAIWTLLSATWSGAPGRALFEFDRVLLYVLVFAFFGMLVPGKRRLEWGLRGFAAAALVLCAVGWVTRIAPDVWPIALNIHPERLSFPLTYWNALGLLAALGILACVHLSAGERESRGWRVGAAAAIPLLASVLLLTFSRGSLAIAFLGLVAYALLARPPRLLTTAGATVLPVGVAMVASYQASTVSSARFASAEGIAEGHELALVVLVCAAVAAVARALLTRADDALEDWIPPILEPRAVAAVIAVAAVALVALLAAFQVPSRIGGEYDEFVNGDVVGHQDDPRARLTSAGNNGRIMQTEVALDAFAEAPLLGKGAGTYRLQWVQHRPRDFIVVDAHSLYAEVLGELGLVGFLLVAGCLAVILAGLARRMGGEERQLYAAVIVLIAAWAVHAGIDWDWEMPAVTVWLFALAGLGLARPLGSRRSAAASFEPGRTVRLVAAICVGVLAVTPAAIAISQSRLDAALGNFQQGRCGAAISGALDSLDVLKVRPEPYEVLGYCDARLGQEQLAEEAMENAVSRDPENWETHYGLALVRALAGRDPMPELYEARRLNPLESKVVEMVRAMRGGGPSEWERRAMEARLPI